MSDSLQGADAGLDADAVDFSSPAYLKERRRALLAAAEAAGFQGADFDDPQGPAGHAYAIRKSTWLTSEFRRVHRKGAMDITPQDVVDVLNAADVKSWVLMGLHGYIGYMPEPRATQDVDVMVRHSEWQKAKKAIAARWPNLTIRTLSQVVRFADPGDLDAEGRPKQVVDLMAPFAPFQELILKEYVVRRSGDTASVTDGGSGDCLEICGHDFSLAGSAKEIFGRVRLHCSCHVEFGSNQPGRHPPPGKPYLGERRRRNRALYRGGQKRRAVPELTHRGPVSGQCVRLTILNKVVNYTGTSSLTPSSNRCDSSPTG